MTLIDKAEAHDDDLIRRGDARKAMADYHWNRHASRAEGGTLSSPAVFTSHTWQDVQGTIDAIPARGVNVDAGIDALEVHLREIGYSAIPWREWPEKDQADVRAALRIAILAALAPTDAAHVNETPKSEHDAGNVLTAAQAREAAQVITKNGAEATAAAMILHIAETLRAKGKAVLTTGDDFGAQVLQFANALAMIEEPRT